MNLGTYSRTEVSNLDDASGRAYFDQGLRHFFSYQHEMASKCFLACLYFSPQCALAHGLVALCHSPNYNFKGDAYYDSTHHPDEISRPDRLCVFPSQQVADRHSRMAVEKVEEIRAMRKRSAGKRKKGTGRGKSGLRALSPEESSSSSSIDIPDIIADVDVQIVSAVRILTCTPGISSGLSVELVGRPYANALRKVHELYPDDAEVSYFLAEALMVLNAWKLYEYPTGRPLSNDVVETREVLEDALTKHKDHAGLCHMYVHLSEMSSDPAKALDYCGPLRNHFPHAGHLIHMPSHVDVLVGDYESVIRWNYAAILADDHTAKSSPDTAGTASFYFGYCVHNYHMLVYGCILGGCEAKAMEVAEKLNLALSEEMFVENPDLVAYLESYSALEIHVMVRFGRWKEILQLKPPEDKHLMLFRAASIKFARGMAYANSGDVEEAKKEADRYDSLRKHPLAETRILHNNQVSDLLAVDAPMLRGEIAYREGKYDDAFRLLRKAVEMQDSLNYDEPWGKMQPIRHALGGLLLEQGNLVEAEEVFRTDLSFHPRNPWGLRGLIQCLEKKASLSAQEEMDSLNAELSPLRGQLVKQRASEWADFNVTVACECCRKDGLKL
jgi:tetratricopeptide (TPR) repeat protein